jgi:hypothetical protein
MSLPRFGRPGSITGQLHRHARSWDTAAVFRPPASDLSTRLGDQTHWGLGQKVVTDAGERRRLQLCGDTELASQMRERGDPAHTCELSEMYSSQFG